MNGKSNGRLALVIRILLILLGLITFIVFIVYIGKTVYWKWLFLLLLFIFIGAYLIGAKEDREENKKRAEYLEAGHLIFAGYKDEFAEFYQSYMRGKKKKKPIEVLYEFADGRGLIQVIDWRGEDSEGEIEEFIEELLGQKIAWTNTSTFRSGLMMDKQREGEFIVDLFKAVDEDLKVNDQRLLFLGLGDTYEYTVVGAKAFGNINKMKISELRGVGALRK